MLVETALEEELAGLDAPPTVRSRAGWWWAAGLLLVVVHVVASAHLPDKGPIIFHDEGGYLGNATLMARGYGRPIDGYYGGYSLLLVPAAWLGSTQRAFYEAVLFTNALLALVTAALAYRLVRQLFPRLGANAAGAIAAIVVLQPYVFEAAQIAMSENVLVPTTLLTALLLARFAERRTVRAGIAAGAGASFAFWTSPRGILVVAACLGALAVDWWFTRRDGRTLAVVSAATCACTAAGFAFNYLLRDGTKTPGADDPSRWPPIGHLSTWRDVAAATAGRIAYIGVATFGLALVGALVAGAWAVRRARVVPGSSERAQVVVGSYALSSVVMTLLLSSITMRVERIDILYYGRYVEGVAMPLVVIGAGWLLARPQRWSAASATRLALTVAGVIVACGLVAELYADKPPGFTETSINILAFFAIRQVTHLAGYLPIIVVGAAVTAGALALCAARARVAIVAVVALSVVTSWVVYDQFQVPFTKLRAPNTNVAPVLEALGRADPALRCVVYDPVIAQDWPVANDAYLLPRWKFRQGTADAAPAGCRALVLAPQRPTTPGDWQLAASDTFFELTSGLWVDIDSLSPAARAELEATPVAVSPTTAP